MNATEYAELTARIQAVDDNRLTALLLDLLDHVAVASGFDPQAPSEVSPAPEPPIPTSSKKSSMPPADTAAV